MTESGYFVGLSGKFLIANGAVYNYVVSAFHFASRLNFIFSDLSARNVVEHRNLNLGGVIADRAILISVPTRLSAGYGLSLYVNQVMSQRFDNGMFGGKKLVANRTTYDGIITTGENASSFYPVLFRGGAAYVIDFRNFFIRGLVATSASIVLIPAD